MSNQFLKLRRSAVPGKVPETSSLEYGEIALNTYDGLAFMKKSGSSGEEVVTIGSTAGAFTGSFSGSFTGSLQGTASWAFNALTASTADNFLVRQNITASNALIQGTITAQTLVVQTISSSIIYSSGSNKFGDELTDSQQFTGSVTITGSLNSPIITGSLFGTASWAQNFLTSSVTSASYALTASYVNPLNQQVIITGSLIQGVAGNIASGTGSHAEGDNTQAIGIGSHAEGTQLVGEGTTPLIAYGDYSHAEGGGTLASGSLSHAEGETTIARGYASHTEGQSTETLEGASYAHAEGQGSIAAGPGSHAEGYYTIASGLYSHAEGFSTETYGQASHAGGFGTVALGNYQYVVGSLNISSSDQSAFIIGNGVQNQYRSNLVFASGSQFQITGSTLITGSLTSIGNLIVTGSVSVSGSQGDLFTANIDTLLLTGSLITTGSMQLTGSMNVLGSITSSLFGTASWAQNALTASFLIGHTPYQITTGSITASVGVDPNETFLIKSGSVTFLNISSSGDTTVNSNLFIIKNIITQQPVLTVSQSIVQIATQSLDPTGTIDAGSIWITANNIYIALD
jgi:hypothetical protein